MREFPSLIMYPVFRVTVAMGIGIFLSDGLLGDDMVAAFWKNLSGSSGVNEVAGSPGFDWEINGWWMVLSALMLVLVLLIWADWYATFRRNGRGNGRGNGTLCGCLKRQRLFGWLTFVAFVLFGGFRLMQERAWIDFAWSKERRVYCGEVMTSPVQKGKMCQAEVWVKGCKEILTSTDSCRNSIWSVNMDSYLMQDTALALKQNGGVFAPINRRILLYWMPDSLQCQVNCGDCMLFAAKIGHPVSAAELTGFDYPRYLYRKGISGTAMVFTGEWQVWGGKEKLSLKQLALKCRDWVVNRYMGWGFGDEELAVVAALTVGDKRVLTDTLKEMYSAAGVSHVLALSGLHVGIISALLFFLLAPLTRLMGGQRMRSFLVVLALWAFAFVTGLSASVVRAVTMCSLYFVASCVREGGFPSVYVWVLAAFLMLVYQPLYLFDMSCQLSFLAVAAILFFYPIVSDFWRPRGWLLSWVWNGVSVSVAAQLGTLPLILFYFGTFPTYFLLANLVVSVLAVCVLGGSLAALVLADLPFIGQVVVCLLDKVTGLMNDMVGSIRQLAGAQLESLEISALQAACGLVFLAMLYEFLQRRKAVSLVGMLLALNVAVVDWGLEALAADTDELYLWRSHLYLKQDKKVTELMSANQLFVVDSLRIGIVCDDSWRWKKSNPTIPLDYLYVSRGFKGSLKQLLYVFRFERIILDASLTPFYRNRLKQECAEQCIPCIDISENTKTDVYKIHL